ncbi:hypothetical protein FIBSPDRAFT_965030 [Athelia psychrophila]|uniref:Uncharacterized protein n=1 Tax=Athelia psychrophila TaxID=1759441 RepID=A0A165X3Q2_9AGAM|nr:hypothetical protein FIBSPDRAFT_965030 [Fibularhizoctonia sp. CBS 109695]
MHMDICRSFVLEPAGISIIPPEVLSCAQVPLSDLFTYPLPPSSPPILRYYTSQLPGHSTCLTLKSLCHGTVYPAFAALKNVVSALDSLMTYEEVPAQFRRIESALSGAKMERAAAENRSKPVSSLPPEILAHIFQTHRNLHDGIWADVTPPSIRVSHVSAVWRDTALSEPSLWTKLVASPAYSLDFYNTMIFRSKQSQLAIAIEPKGPEYSRSAHALAELICSQSHRLRTLRIQATIHFLQQHIPSLRNLSAPYMAHLQFSNTSPVFTEVGNPLNGRVFTGGTWKRLIFESHNMPLQFHPPLTAIYKMAFSPQVPSTSLRCILLS